MCLKCLLTALLHCGAWLCLAAQSFEADGLRYNIISKSEKSAEVTYSNSLTAYSGHIVIPEEVVCEGETYRVTAIKRETFWGCTGLTGITLPSSITAIDDYLFYGCTALTNIAIPSSVTSIGKEAFAHCSNLKTVTLGKNLVSIGEGAFKHCTKIESVTIPHSTTEIGASAFEFCTALKEITLGNKLASIGSSAFLGCSAIEGIELPASLASIGEFAFYGCSAIEKLHIPQNVTTIGQHAFNNCTALKEMSVASGNNRYDSRDGCNAIIETATNTLLQGCNTTLPARGITTINEWAFYNCADIKNAYLPATITSVGEWAFYNCDSITSVNIPQGATTIGDGAFYECDNITQVRSRAQEPALIGYYTFKQSYSRATLYVPHGTKATYLASDYWSNFGNIAEITTTIYCGVNLDGLVDVADITATTEMIATPALATPDGDIDCNGVVDTQDVACIIETIESTKVVAEAPNGNTTLAATSEESAIIIEATNPEYPFSAMQLDLYLPTGIEGDDTAGKPFITLGERACTSHTATSHPLADGATRIIIHSPANENFTGTSGCVAKLQLKACGAKDGHYTFDIRNIKISSNGTKENLSHCTGGITITDGTLDINQPIVEKEEEGDGTIYDLSGRKVTLTTKGNIYIKNGKKFTAP